MKISRICALVLLVVVGSAVAFADSINDPKVIINGSVTGTPCGNHHNCRDIANLNFNFKIPPSGNGILYFTNETGQNWTSLSLVLNPKGLNMSDFSCGSELFQSCKVQTLKDGDIRIQFTGVIGGKWPADGIPNGTSFFVRLECSPSCWPSGSIGVHANNPNGTGAPEPTTMALMMTGAGMIFSRRKFWKKNP